MDRQLEGALRWLAFSARRWLAFVLLTCCVVLLEPCHLSMQRATWIPLTLLHLTQSLVYTLLSGLLVRLWLIAEAGEQSRAMALHATKNVVIDATRMQPKT